jgi:hypothetical protein
MTESAAFKVEWHDSGREPQVAPNPAYPRGIDLDISGGAAHACTAALPYPARRCGHYSIECRLCGIRVAVTTAGRPDDPRSVTIACKPMRGSGHD